MADTVCTSSEHSGRYGRLFQRRAGLIWGCYLGGDFAALQSPMLDSLAVDALSFGKDVCGPAEVGMRRGHVAQALVVAVMIVALDLAWVWA